MLLSDQSYDKESFVQDVILPMSANNQYAKTPWTLRDTHHNFLLTSDIFATTLGFSGTKELVNKNLDILPHYDESYKRDLYEYDLEVIKNKKIIKRVTAFNVHNKTVVRLITMIPILFDNEVIAINIPGMFVSQHGFDFISYKKIHNITNVFKKYNVAIDDILMNDIEKKIGYLMLLGKSQSEIADTLNCSRSKIAKTIAHICERNNIPGSSGRLLIDLLISVDYHKKISPEFFML